MKNILILIAINVIYVETSCTVTCTNTYKNTNYIIRLIIENHNMLLGIRNDIDKLVKIPSPPLYPFNPPFPPFPPIPRSPPLLPPYPPNFPPNTPPLLIENFILKFHMYFNILNSAWYNYLLLFIVLSCLYNILYRFICCSKKSKYMNGLLI